MTNPQLHQLQFNSEKAINSQIADILENLHPAPVSTSFFEDKDKSWVTTAHYIEQPSTEQIINQIKEIIGITPDQYKLTLNQTEDIDWVSHVQKQLKPVCAGRFFIHGSHDSEKAKDQTFSIEIDAAQAFGTAHHETTEGCLNAIDELSSNISPKTILDLGSGTGILAIAASKVWPNAQITASDIDPIAVTIASENETRNRAPSSASTPITHLCIDGVKDSEIEKRAPFELIIANILAKPLMSMAPDINNILKENGYLLLSGILGTQSNDIIKAYESTGLYHQKTNHLGEWTTSLFSKQK